MLFLSEIALLGLLVERFSQAGREHVHGSFSQAGREPGVGLLPGLGELVKIFLVLAERFPQWGY